MHRGHRSSWFSGLLVLGICLSSNQSVTGQEDFIQQARTYPPQFLNPEGIENALATIEWKMRQLDGNLAQVQGEISRLDARRQGLQQDLDSAKNQMPPGFRFMTAITRSELAGRLVEEIINAKLELATAEATVEALVREKDAATAKFEGINRTAIEIAERTAEMRLEIAQKKLDQQMKLRDKDYVPESEVLNARMELGLAEAEVENVKSRMMVESSQMAASFAERIADQRVAIQAVRARMKAAEAALSAFSESVPQLSAIESLQGEWDAVLARQASWNTVHARIGQEKWELEILANMLRTHVRKEPASSKEK